MLPERGRLPLRRVWLLGCLAVRHGAGLWGAVVTAGERLVWTLLVLALGVLIGLVCAPTASPRTVCPGQGVILRAAGEHTDPWKTR